MANGQRPFDPLNPTGLEQRVPQTPNVPTAATGGSFDPVQGVVVPGITTPTERLADIGAPAPTGAAFRFLEALRTPQSAIFSGLIAGQDPDLSFGQVFGKRPSFEDVLTAGGVPEFAGRGLVEFAGDVVFDPLNIVPLTGLGRGILRLAGRTGMGGVRALERWGVPGVEGAHKGLTRAFRGALSEEAMAARKMATQSTRMTRRAAGEIDTLMKSREAAVGKLAREIGVPKAELDSAIAARVEAKVDAFGDLSVSETLLDSLGASGESIFDLKGLSAIAREGGGFDPRRLAPLSDEAEELLTRSGLVDEFKDSAIKQLQLEKQGGLTPKALDSSRLDYLLHAMHPAAKEVLLENPVFRQAGRTWNPEHASLLARELREVSATEINALSLQGRLAMTKGKKIPLFIDNPSVLDAMRAYRGARAVASAGLFTKTIDNFGMQIPKTGQKLMDAAAELGLPSSATFDQVRMAAIKSGRRTLAGDRARDVWLREEVAGVIDNYFDIARNPDLLKRFMGHMGNVQNGWKAWTLAVFPEYHTRNIVGNVWNNWLAGLNNPAWYKRASALQTIATKGKIAPTMVRRLTNAAEEAVPQLASKRLTYGKVTQTAQEWIDELAEAGATRGGIFGAELDQAQRDIVSATTSKTRQVLRGSTGPVRAGFAVGQMFEDNARVAHYLWKRSKGATVEEAGDSVKHFLFNYDELDPFTEAARKVMPFLTWTRFNVPLQLEHLITDPNKAAVLNKFRIAIENSGPVSFGPIGEAIGIPGIGEGKEAPDERFVADWVRENMGIRVRRTGKNDYEFFTLENWIPLADLSEVGLPQLEEGVGAFAEQAGDFAIGLLSPLLTGPVEFATNQSLFLGREFLPERREFLGVDVPERYSNVLRNLRVLSVVDRFIVAPKGTSLGSNLVRTLTGIRVTPQDIRRGRRVFYGDISQQERDLGAARRRALDNGRLKEAKRLEKKLLETKRKRWQR